MLALTTEPLVRDWKVVEGRILEIEPARRLVMTCAAHWDEAVTRDPASRVTYELTPIDPTTTKLRLVHDDFAGQTATYKGQRHLLSRRTHLPYDQRGDDLLVLSHDLQWRSSAWGDGRGGPRWLADGVLPAEPGRAGRPRGRRASRGACGGSRAAR